MLTVTLSRGSREAVHADVETELREAMSDTVKEEGERLFPLVEEGGGPCLSSLALLCIPSSFC